MGSDRTGSRVRDAEATRSRILNAATAEFSALGLAGARTARIAEKAEASQRMIYAYFSNKDGLFDAVLEHNILLIQNAVTFEVEDLPGYAQKVFDFYRANPDLVRLELWQTLERPDALRSMPVIQAAREDNISALARAQAAGTISNVLPPAQLLDQILTLAHGHVMDSGDSAAWPDERRRALAVTITALTVPGPASG